MIYKKSWRSNSKLTKNNFSSKNMIIMKGSGIFFVISCEYFFKSYNYPVKYK